MQRGENKSKEWEMLYMAYRTIFDLNKANISQSAHTLFDIFDNNLSYSFNLTISQMIYSSFIAQPNDPNVYIIFINEIEALQKQKSKHRICEIFTQLLLKKASQESNYLLENMIEQNLIDKNITKNINSKYFAHYKTKKENKQRTYIDPFEKQFIKNYEELSKNDWALHKQLIKEGHNPNEIAKIIRKDEVEKLQEISSQTNFDFNQKIEPSLYERCSFVNHENVTLIDYAAYFGSVKCFKYLFMNDPDVEDTYEYAIAGGNLEIIHLCEQSHLSFWKPYETAIKFHQNDIFKYLYEKEAFNSFGEKCVSYNNYEILSFLEKKE